MANITFDAMKQAAQRIMEQKYQPPVYYVSPTYAEWMRKFVDNQYAEWPQKNQPMKNLDVTLNGVKMQVQNINCEREEYARATRYTIEGYLLDETVQNGDTMKYTYAVDYGGSGIGVTAEDFLSRPIGTSVYFDYVGGGDNMREGTQGSYAYGVAQLAEGLKSAVDSGFITADEAKTEFRANVATVARADEQARYEAERIEALEKELAELREKAAETS